VIISTGDDVDVHYTSPSILAIVYAYSQIPMPFAPKYFAKA
jgi:hypothetical protein